MCSTWSARPGRRPTCRAAPRPAAPPSWRSPAAPAPRWTPRDYVIPDDVKALALPVLRHRVILSPAAEIEGRRADEVIAGLVERAAAPRLTR